MYMYTHVNVYILNFLSDPERRTSTSGSESRATDFRVTCGTRPGALYIYIYIYVCMWGYFGFS